MRFTSAAIFFQLVVSQAFGAPVKVSVSPPPGQGLLRDGQPYFVRGAGGTDHLKRLAEAGGNSLRTWSTENLEGVLKQADVLKLTVSAGIWLEPECDWFSYHKPGDCARQAERVLKEIAKYQNYPALLAWGLGNEAEGDGSNADFWKQLENLALKARAADPDHPVFTALAGMSAVKARALNEMVPHLDYVGINTYGGIFSLRKSLADMGWTRPWLVTEWGPQGFWECRKSSWGAPWEQTSTGKALMMDRAYREVIGPGGDCLGSYAFVWDWKYEATATWFGLFTQNGETTASVDVLESHWKGKSAVNQAPRVEELKGVPEAPVAAKETFTVTTSALDPESDTLAWRWEVKPEHPPGNPALPGPPDSGLDRTIGNPDAREKVTVTAPAVSGNFRLYLYITDGKGHAATANAPFSVK